MNKKIVGIFIITLLIGTTIPTIGMMNEYIISNEINIEDIQDYKFVPGEFIIKFKESPILSLSIDEFNEKNDVISMEKMYDNVENTPLDNIYMISVPINSDILSLVEIYSAFPNVEFAEPNYIIKSSIKPIKYDNNLDIDKIKYIENPDDPFFNMQWNLENTGQHEGTPGCDINALNAWDIEKGSEKVIIAIVDSGVDYNHPDLADNIWVNEDEIPDNDIDDDNNGYIDDYYGYDAPTGDKDNTTLDKVGHGTFCAGIASAVTNNGIGIAGVAWNCKIMIVQPWDENYTALANEISDSIKYAVDNGADIISMSYGTKDYGALRVGYEYAYEKGAVLIAAAANYNTSDTKYCYPGAYDYVIRVAATNQRDERCDVDDWGYSDSGDPLGSNFGESVDVAAPGNYFMSTSPTYEVKYDWYNLNYTNNEGGGTSWSTPLVAGIAALLLSQDPNLTNEEVRKILCANVDPYTSEEYIGTGRVNAYKALTRFNTEPEKPETPTGRTNGKPDREYKFKSSTTDPDGDELWYLWDWGDGNYSEWLGPYASGNECEASYAWKQEANFSIKVKSKDGKGGVSSWSEEFIFSTPKNKAISTAFFFQRLLQHFPFFENILNQIII